MASGPPTKKLKQSLLSYVMKGRPKTMTYASRVGRLHLLNVSGAMDNLLVSFRVVISSKQNASKSFQIASQLLKLRWKQKWHIFGDILHRSTVTLDQFIFWPKLPPNAWFRIKNLKKKIPGVTHPRTPSVGGGDPLLHPPPARLHAVCGGTSSPLLGPRSWKPFPQIKIYHYTPANHLMVSVHPAVKKTGLWWMVTAVLKRFTSFTLDDISTNNKMT